MNYKKKYDEALERARKIHGEIVNNELIGFPGQIEAIFPQLRESEDERIRKFLVDYFASYKIGNVTTKLNGVRIDDILNYLEKQKEQKPNFSEKDSTDFEIEVHEIIAQARNDSRLDDADVLKQFEEEAAFALMLKANKLIEQKPAEWGEEDRLHYANVLEALEYVKGCKSDYDKIEAIKSDIAWFKSLRGRPKSSDN